MSAATTGRPSSKRPRSSSSAPSDSPLRKKRLSSSSFVAASPLVRSVKVNTDIDDPVPRKLPATTAPPPTPPSPPPPPPRRRARLSLPPPEPDRRRPEGSVASSAASEDAEDTADFEELLRDGFSFQEAALFQRIRKRGLEPLMPAHWQVDFATMPDNLFSAPDSPAYIDAMTLGGTFNATTAFQALVNLGAMVRGKLEGKQEVESKILLGLRKYVQWSIDDAKLGEIQKLRSLAATLRAEEEAQAKQGCPTSGSSSTIYGLAVAGCVAALTTLEARSPDAHTRTLLVVDFSDGESDFWNAVAISLLVMASRNDEIDRADFYKAYDIKKPVRTPAWRGKARKSAPADSDEDA